jgi:hypothetical protein
MSVGRTPSSAPDPWSGSANAIQAEADEGVGRGPGGNRPTAGFVKELRKQDTSVAAYYYRSFPAALSSRTAVRCTTLDFVMK